MDVENLMDQKQRLDYLVEKFNVDTDEENMSPFLKVVTNKYFATVITLVLAYMLTKVGYAEIWPLSVLRTSYYPYCSCSLCSILKENKTSGLHALDPDGIHDGSYLHSTWHDHHKTFKSTGNNRTGSTAE